MKKKLNLAELSSKEGTESKNLLQFEAKGHMIYLSVVIPCFNEAENLKRGVLTEIYNYLNSQNFSWEVIISDDGSSDKSLELLQEQTKKFKNFKVLVNIHGGKPYALWQGIKEAHGQLILFTDIDQSTPINQLEKLLPYAKDGQGVIIGSRGMARKNFPIYRKIGANVFRIFRQLLILPEIWDTQCGFKLFKADVLKKSFPQLEFFKKENKVKGWKVTSFDVELLHIIKKNCCPIKEVEVLWEDKDISSSKGSYIARYIKESWEMLGQIVRVKVNDMSGRY